MAGRSGRVEWMIGGGPCGGAARLGSGIGDRLGRGGVCKGDRLGRAGGEDRAGVGEPRVGGGGNGAAVGLLNAGGGGGNVFTLAVGRLLTFTRGGGGGGGGVPLYGSQFVLARGTLDFGISKSGDGCV